MTLRSVLTLALAGSLLSGTALAQDKAQERILKYRQASMALVGDNFGFMGAMMKGEIPWNGEAFARRAQDLAAVSSLDLLRGYPEGSEGGKTKAKADIWLSFDDFKEKMEAFQAAAPALAKAAQAGDKGQAMDAFKDTAKTCKGCHKEYKSKEWLNQ
ncbi:MAG: c-type cytochrome [Gammaproteobacteria bacterium]